MKVICNNRDNCGKMDCFHREVREQAHEMIDVRCHHTNKPVSLIDAYKDTKDPNLLFVRRENDRRSRPNRFRFWS